MKKYKLIIFDLDGTLLDTSKGIFNSVRYAERMMGFKPIEENKLKKFVGPPPKDMYMKSYGVSENIALLAARYHREYGRTKAVYEASIYPGIVEVLNILKNRGYKLAVATLKSQKIAEKILKHFNLDIFFDKIVGMNDLENLTKADTIEIVMEQSNIVSKKDVLMVGDSEYDKIGAEKVGIDFVGVLYGFGFKNSKQISDEKNYISNINQLENLV